MLNLYRNELYANICLQIKYCHLQYISRPLTPFLEILFSGYYIIAFFLNIKITFHVCVCVFWEFKLRSSGQGWQQA